MVQRSQDFLEFTCGHAQRGNVALSFGLMLPLLLAAGGAAIDTAMYASARSTLQEIADAAALAGGREYLLSKASSRLALQRAESVASGLIEAEKGVGGATAAVSADSDGRSVTVSISFGYRPTLFIAMIRSPIMIGVSSTAEVSGGSNICVIGLDREAGDTIKLDDRAVLRGRECSVFSNSTDPHAIVVNGSALIDSAFICSAGGYDGPITAFDPAPLTDCPRRDDPLSERREPTPGLCDHTNLQLADYRGRLSPGVYCGGLVIDGASEVEFAPGVYVMKDGELQVKANSRIYGEEVGFFFMGAGSRAMFEDKVEVSLSAPVTGEMAGILFWLSKFATGVNTFEIKSNLVDRLVGTIYLPNGELYVLVTEEVAEASAYTAIIADHIWLVGRSRLILNTNYALTPVPPPPGIAGAGEELRLRQ